MDPASAQMSGAGRGCIALGGAGVGIGNVFSSLISAVARNPAAQGQVQPFAFLGFALAEATGLFGLAIAFLLLFVFYPPDCGLSLMPQLDVSTFAPQLFCLVVWFAVLYLFIA